MVTYTRLGASVKCVLVMLQSFASCPSSPDTDTQKDKWCADSQAACSPAPGTQHQTGHPSLQGVHQSTDGPSTIREIHPPALCRPMCNIRHPCHQHTPYVATILPSRSGSCSCPAPPSFICLPSLAAPSAALLATSATTAAASPTPRHMSG